MKVDIVTTIELGGGRQVTEKLASAVPPPDTSTVMGFGLRTEQFSATPFSSTSWLPVFSSASDAVALMPMIGPASPSIVIR